MAHELPSVASIGDRVNPLRSAARLAAGLLIGASVLGGCSTPPQSYPTPEAAVDALIAAARVSDTSQLRTILGSEADELLSSGDEVADTQGRLEFVRLYDERHGLAEVDDGTRTLQVGATEWPIPVPLVEGDAGWYFDTAAGLDEMLSRRIGRNELAAIQVCLAVADAQREYARRDYTGNGWREYATQFNSDPGKRNGLYWPAREGQPESPLGELIASATSEGYFAKREEGPRPYHGYYYRILTAQGPDAPGGALDFVAQGHMIGGFAVVAWPAEYANSGLKTFLISHHGTVYERDLGDDTARIAKSMKVYNPGAGWTPVGTMLP